MTKFIKSPLKRNPAHNKILKVAGQLFIIIILVSILILPYFVFAQEVVPTLKDNLKALGGAAGFEEADETTAAGIAGTIVNIFLSVQRSWQEKASESLC